MSRRSEPTGAVSVMDSTGSIPEAGPGSNPRAALHALRVEPVSLRIAKAILVNHHYLHSVPGGTCLAFGVFVESRLKGAMTLGVGPANTFRLVEGAGPEDCLTLTRLWVADELPKNSESRVIGIVLRALRRHTELKFLVTYADPAQGHQGTVYMASNWAYTGLSQAMPLLDLGDGVARHSRSVSHGYGTHSLRHFARHGVDVRLVPQAAKHRFFFFLDRTWRDRLRVPVLPNPRE